MAHEDKTQFEEIEKKLSVSPSIIATALSMKDKNIYQTYRKASKINFFKVLAFGVYILRSGLDIDDVVKSIEYAKDMKGTR